jgi:hypothetical protein
MHFENVKLNALRHFEYHPGYKTMPMKIAIHAFDVSSYPAYVLWFMKENLIAVTP